MLLVDPPLPLAPTLEFVDDDDSPSSPEHAYSMLTTTSGVRIQSRGIVLTVYTESRRTEQSGPPHAATK